MTLQRRFVRTVGGFGALALGAVVLAPLVGPTAISLRRVFDWSIPFADNTDAQIFFVARLPRTLSGAIVGALLGAHYGEDHIPTEWRARVLGATGLRVEYHPNVLLGMIEAA